MTRLSFTELLELARERARQLEIEETGIEGYCQCCGEPYYVDKEMKHDKECIWYERTN